MAISVFSPTIPCKYAMLSPIFTATLLLILTQFVLGFVIHPSTDLAMSRIIPVLKIKRLQAHNKKHSIGDEEGEQIDGIDLNGGEDDDDYDLEPVFVADVRGRPAGVVIEDLSWRVEKLRLEEANKRRFLKAGPRFLPYGECKKWVQAWGERWTSAQEWNEWIAAGEKRNSYIPSRPEEYYTRTGHWISW
eukprot:CAMPEP_0197193398 /NCGR_PEP_ID=MMETSP1423-20130617/27091_1 /TAXON_ID=476441 /ORGANISM="Pseudo-nitzschia heimii, Strain UNC1101" /LENGTH=189 /DNA_ID=CAMNT_0042646583 /DNA_START=142 /DNA_END=708 /DNA_ORIENTATION=+